MALRQKVNPGAPLTRWEGALPGAHPVDRTPAACAPLPPIVGSRVRLPWAPRTGRIVDLVFGGTPAMLLFAVVAQERDFGMPPSRQHVPWCHLRYSREHDCYTPACADEVLLAEALRLNTQYPAHDRGAGYRLVPSSLIH